MKWEYKTIVIPTHGDTLVEKLTSAHARVDGIRVDSFLNKFGDDGWELVSAFSANNSTGMTREVVAIFKRQKT